MPVPPTLSAATARSSGSPDSSADNTAARASSVAYAGQVTDRVGADQRTLVGPAGDRDQLRDGFGLARAPGAEGLGLLDQPPAAPSHAPGRERLLGPLRLLEAVAVAQAFGIPKRSVFSGTGPLRVWSRIFALMLYTVGGHVAFHAGAARALGRMVRVRGDVRADGGMAARAQLLVVGAQRRVLVHVGLVRVRVTAQAGRAALQVAAALHQPSASFEKRRGRPSATHAGSLSLRGRTPRAAGMVVVLARGV
jgi:hypothetical protein